MNPQSAFSDDWKPYSLSEIITLIGGGTPKTTNTEYWGGDIPWLSVKDFNNNFRYVYTTEKTITQLGLEQSSTTLLQKDDIIISARGTVGETAMIPYPMAFNQSCYGIRAKGDLVDSIFLYYLLETRIKTLKNNAHGSVFDTITRDTFDGISIDLPPLPIQKKIAALLSSLDDKIELNTRMNNVLEEIARALFRRWFVAFEFPDNEGKPYKSAGGKMVESEIGRVPEGWNVRKLNDISKEIICGKTPSTKILEYYGNSTPFITIPDMHNQVYAISTERYLSINGVQSQPKKTIPKNSICVSCIATPGLVCLTAKNSQTNQQINSIVCKDEISPYFIYFSMLNISEFICTLGSSGSTTSNLNKGQFSKIKLIIPSCEIMKEFDKITSPIFKQIKGNQIESQMLTEVRDTLLPKLMSGEIEV